MTWIHRIGVLMAAVALSAGVAIGADRPNIVLVMADDMGWGQTSYFNHPHLKTPHLDAMAANGLRMDRFYAGAPVCSPTRASVLTGRTNDRGGVRQHGYALHLQEKTIAQAVKTAGYATGHFGKWHLNGLRGAGAPLLKGDPYHPGHFGFDEWLTVTNFFDMNPIMSRKGKWEEFEGDSSEVAVAEALEFIEQKAKAGQPSFTVIWYGSPHSPWIAFDEDMYYEHDKDTYRHHYGELVAMDRSIGALRSKLRELGIADNTLVWFNSDNGGLAKNFGPDAVGGLRGSKGTLFEGGLRVPGIVEWPAKVKPRVTEFPACTMDIMPTLLDILGLPDSHMLDVVDGISLKKLFAKEIGQRDKPIGFHFQEGAAMIDNNYKIIALERGNGKYLLYDLDRDFAEENDLFKKNKQVAQRMKRALEDFNASVARSKEGKDYPEGYVTKEGPHFRFWSTTEEYKPYLEQLFKRPEYQAEQKRQ
ncbi:MAG: sulfatase family protein [Planctomycetota bacterium]|jgi:arylsulfatase A-like enzyme